MARVYKATVYVIDYDGVDFGSKERFAEELKDMGDNHRYFSFGKISDVKGSKEFEWGDSIDLNQIDASEEIYESYFDEVDK